MAGRLNGSGTACWRILDDYLKRMGGKYGVWFRYFGARISQPEMKWISAIRHSSQRLSMLMVTFTEGLMIYATPCSRLGCK